MKIVLLTLTLYLCTWIDQARSDVLIGTGVSNVTQGRVSPMLYGGIDQPKWAVLASALGVNHPLYYQSTYQIGAYLQSEFGEFIWGEIRAGAGLGILYSSRGYREDVDLAVQERDDIVFGPVMRVRWDVAPMSFIGVESLYGVRSVNTLALSFQHVTNLVLGVRF